MGKGRTVPAPERVTLPLYSATGDEVGSVDLTDELASLVATHRRILKRWHATGLFPVDMADIVTQGLPPYDDTPDGAMLWFSALCDGVGMVLAYGRAAGKEMAPFEFVVLSELQDEGRARMGRPYTTEELQTNLNGLYERGTRIIRERTGTTEG